MAKTKRKNGRRICSICNKSPAIFYYHGRWKADDEHDVCPRCFKAELDSARGEDYVL